MNTLRIGYQGIPGCYSEQAVDTCLNNGPTVAVGYQDFPSTFRALERRDVDRILIPIENSLGGSIHLNYDLMQEHAFYITGEYNLQVSHCLMAKRGVVKTDIERVISHPQALSQCRENLEKLDITPQEYYDTAGAAKDLLKLPNNMGALASKSAAQKYGLDIIEENMEDDDGNFTRFLLLSATPASRDIDENVVQKSTLVFSLENSAGALYRVLSIFSLYGIDLTKIESRPRRNRRDSPHTMFDYLFYLEYLSDTASTKKILEPLGQTIDYYKLLGSYPVNNHIYQPHNNLHVGILGFGRFGQFLSQKIKLQHCVSAHSRSNYSDFCHQHDINWCKSMPDFLEARPDVIIISVSIKSFKAMLEKLIVSIELLKDYRPLIVDVLSVKEYPIGLMEKILPEKCDILATHPMFGPDSCSTDNWTNQPFVYAKTRINNCVRCSSFLSTFKECKLIQLDGSEHDKLTSKSQFIAHLVGNIMGELKLDNGPIDTATYKSLLRIRDLIKSDSQDLFQGLYRYNSFSDSSLCEFQKSVGDVVESLRISLD